MSRKAIEKLGDDALTAIFQKIQLHKLEKVETRLEMINLLVKVCDKNRIGHWEILNANSKLYLNSDKFLILTGSGKVEYFHRVLQNAYSNYGQQFADFNELAKIINIVYNYMSTHQFHKDCEYPVYPSGSFLEEIKSYLKIFLEQTKHADETTFVICVNALKSGLEDAEKHYDDDIMTR